MEPQNIVKKQSPQVHVESSTSETVEPEEPEATENTVTIPETKGVNYLVEDNIVTGTVDIPTDGITVEIQAQSGYTTDNVSWSFEYENIEYDTDQPARANNIVTIPETQGVEYLVNDTIVEGSIDVPETGL